MVLMIVATSRMAGFGISAVLCAPSARGVRRHLELNCSMLQIVVVG